MTHDRKIVGPQVPQDIEVVLKQPQIDAHGIVIVDVAQLTRINQFPYEAHGTRVNKRMVHHENPSLPLGQIDKLLSLRHRARHWFLKQYMFTALQSGPGKLMVSRDGRGNCHGIDIVCLQQFTRQCRCSHKGVMPLNGLQLSCGDVRHAHELNVLQLAEIPDEIRSPVAAANHTDTQQGQLPPLSDSWTEDCTVSQSSKPRLATETSQTGRGQFMLAAGINDRNSGAPRSISQPAVRAGRPALLEV